jgi:transposase
MRYELTDHEGAVIKPMLRNKPRGVLWVNDRRVLNGIFCARGATWERPLSAPTAAPDLVRPHEDRGETFGAGFLG